VELLIYSKEIENLEEGLEQKNGLQEVFLGGISVELGINFSTIEPAEHNELGNVDKIPKVAEVRKSYFPHSNNFEHEKENLDEKAHGVAYVEQEQV